MTVLQILGKGEVGLRRERFLVHRPRRRNLHKSPHTMASVGLSSPVLVRERKRVSEQLCARYRIRSPTNFLEKRTSIITTRSEILAVT